uniref:Uncharacterized protein MANES_07G104400 n=1 Tax=Rhizophora mucronata TaxID=61149 RepID=A0A2P2M285_RHIMU
MTLVIISCFLVCHLYTITFSCFIVGMMVENHFFPTLFVLKNCIMWCEDLPNMLIKLTD